MPDVTECTGRYCPCRRHLDPNLPQWVLDNYMPSPWAMEVLHAMWIEGRTESTTHEQAIAWAELENLMEPFAPPRHSKEGS